MTDQETPGRDGGQPDIGSVAEEAAKLLGALQDWASEAGADQSRAGVRGVAEGLTSIGDHVGHGQDCRYCPLCQALRLIRETSPEVRDNLAVAVGALAQAATAALRQPPSTSQDPEQDTGPHRVDLDD